MATRRAGKKKTSRRAAPARRAARGGGRRAPARKAARRPAGRARAKHVRAGVGAVTPSLVVRDCARALAWWADVFGAREESRMMSPDGRGVWHAELRIGDSVVFANDAMGAEVGTGNTSLYVYVPDADEVFRRAVEGGAEVTMPMMDAFWGDRQGMLKDPWGIHWAIATHVEDVAPDEMRRRGEEFARRWAERGGPPA